MKKLINGKTVEFNSSTNRPDRITVDGIVYSTGRMENEEGYSWRTSGDGNVLYFKETDGKGNRIVSYPQRLFTAKKHLKFEQLPKEVQNEIKETLRAYERVSVIFENGEYHVSMNDCLKATYPEDYEVIGEYKADEIYTKEEQIINYVESFHDYPVSYNGYRDYGWLISLGYDWDIKVKFDGNGNLVTK